MIVVLLVIAGVPIASTWYCWYRMILLLGDMEAIVKAAGGELPSTWLRLSNRWMRQVKAAYAKVEPAPDYRSLSSGLKVWQRRWQVSCILAFLAWVLVIAPWMRPVRAGLAGLLPFQ